MTASDLVAKVFQKHLAYDATQANANGVGLAIVHGNDIDAVVSQTLEEPSTVFKIARYAIKRLGNHNIEFATLRRFAKG